MAEDKSKHWVNIVIDANVALAVDIAEFTSAEVTYSRDVDKQGAAGSMAIAGQFTTVQPDDITLAKCMDELTRAVCKYYATEPFTPFPFGDKRKMVVRGTNDLVLIDTDQLMAVSRANSKLWLSINNPWPTIVCIEDINAIAIHEKLAVLLLRSTDGTARPGDASANCIVYPEPKGSGE